MMGICDVCGVGFKDEEGGKCTFHRTTIITFSDEPLPIEAFYCSKVLCGKHVRKCKYCGVALCEYHVKPHLKKTWTGKYKFCKG